MEKPLQDLVKEMQSQSAKQASAKTAVYAKKAATSKKWSEKQAPPEEKKAMDAVLQAIEKACPNPVAKSLVAAAEKNGHIKISDLKKAIKEAQGAKQQAEKACVPLPPEPRKAVEKQVKKSFDDLLSFWKDIEAKAKKTGAAK